MIPGGMVGEARLQEASLPLSAYSIREFDELLRNVFVNYKTLGPARLYQGSSLSEWLD